jgi:hypothetical protein
LVVLVILGMALRYGTRNVSSKTTVLPSTSPVTSPPYSPAQLGAGQTAGRGSGESPVATATPIASPTPSTQIQKPIGQLLNKTSISLSAASTDGQHNSAMVSTVISAAPGSTNSVVAVGTNGNGITVGAPVMADANGQGSEITWDAKTAGLTTGTWQVHILSTLNGNSAVSDSAQLTVGD